MVGSSKTERHIRILNKYVRDGYSPKEFYSLINSAFTGVRISAQTIFNKHIYRARWNKLGRLFDNTSELQYIPRELAIQKGRLNDIGESMFYGAACEMGTIIEARPDINKLITICKIRALNPELLYVPIGRVEAMYNYKELTNSEKIVVDFCNQEITKQVSKPEQYNSTIALARHFLCTNILGRRIVNDKFALIYPSVESSRISNQTTLNIAMIPKVFDSNFKIEQVNIYVLTNESTHYQLIQINRTTNIRENGDLEWQFHFEQMKRRIAQGLAIDEIGCPSLKRINLNSI